MDKLLERDQDKFQLHMLELMSMLLLMLHWQRGIVDMLIATKKVKLKGDWLANWNRVIKDLETYEQFAWEIASPRALLPVLRHYRLTGELLSGYENVLPKDSYGRLPYNGNNLDDVEDLLRRVMDCRIYESNNTQE